MWRDYIPPIATITALLLSTFALVVAQFPLEIASTKWAYIIFVGLLNVVAAGSVIYSTYHSITRQALEKERLAEIREQLGIFIMQGRELRLRTTDETQPPPNREVNEWAAQVETFLLGALGSSYVIRFRSHEGLAPFFCSIASPDHSRLWSAIGTRVARLDQFSALLP